MHESLGITVKEMLDLEVLKGSKVLAGHDGLEGKITKMNVMEVPDIIDWVTTGEFLLTTAYSIKDDIEILKNLIPQLKERNLAGLGIKMRRYVEKLPDEIIQIADALNFPIIEIPLHIAYTDIMMPVLTEIINKQTNTLIKIDEVHNKLMHVMLRGGGINEIARTIGQSIGNSLIIRDTIFDSMVVHCDEEKQEVLQRMIENERISPLNTACSSLGDRITVTSEDEILGKAIKRIQVPIHVDDRHYGYLYVWEDYRKLSAVELISIEAAIPMIALDLSKKSSMFELESRHKIEFFDDLLSADEKRQKQALERSGFFDFDTTLGYGTILITINNADGFIKGTLNNSNFLYQLNTKILQNIERLTKESKGKLVFGNKSDYIILLYGANPSKSPLEVKKEMMELVQIVTQYIEYTMPEIRYSIGVGRYNKEIKNLWRSYNEAMKAVLNKKKNAHNSVMHFDDLGIYRILWIDEMEEELMQFYREMLQPLVLYDKEKDSELVKTLQMYFQCGGNLKKISEEMYTHYNTIIYRIQRIKEITNIDLEEPNGRLNLQVALKIFELIEPK
ncbi:purine catabolism regulator [Anaerosolibacter carboniphilus]|uniref:Purine catabolism regulator n=1 Tax=Anaerosolibacter carboniphilus TaxID=1417629 RepID=A0A841KXB5_9FIRM|nr:PucR family transcriptional regulator [Anaerosolibacter carboniphilus]MBB6216898.1 purine catabolism regulator [Anaerosolibacter carboniphilus]